MHSRVRVIIFSKDRGFQLEACLRSFYSTVCDTESVKLEVLVLYKASDERFLRQYELLSADYPDVQFVEENDFEAQTLAAFDHSDYLLFVVDDTIFIKEWSLASAVRLLDASPHMIGFSLRLGENITYCYPFQCDQPQPAFDRVETGVLSFQWSGEAYDYGYPLEVSSSVYRTEDVFVALKDKRFSRPNELERELAKSAGLFAEEKPKLLMFDTSVAFACPINLVQEHRGNIFGQEHALDVAALAQKFDEGLLMDLSFGSNFVPVSCHQEIGVEFIERKQLPGK